MTTILNSLQAVFDSGAQLGAAYNISDKEFNAIRSLLYEEAGISLGEGKRSLVCSRLAKRLRELKLSSYDNYLNYLATRDPQGVERQVMINCLTTNKTDFFREPHHFAYLRDVVFPRVKQRAAQGGPRRLRIWSAGCSMGDEPYTIALTILEHFGSRHGWDIRILASDINTEVLDPRETRHLRAGSYRAGGGTAPAKIFPARHGSLRRPLPGVPRCPAARGISSDQLDGRAMAVQYAI